MGRKDPVKRAKIVSYQRAYEQRLRANEELLANWKIRRRETHKKRYYTLKAQKQEQQLLG
jgi:hypothetical protein